MSGYSHNTPMSPRFFIPLALLIVLPVVLAQSPNTIDREASIRGILDRRVFFGPSISDVETPLQIRWILYYNIAGWNAWCNYHPTAVDIFGRNRFKRPAVEHTRENKNTAILFSVYRIYEASPQSFGDPNGINNFRNLIRELGFDPDNRSTDLTTPIGIGNRAGLDTARLMAIDGWNSEGDLTGTQSNYKTPFQDYTGYTPMNNPWTIKHPFKWQPLLESNGAGFFFRQEHVTPYAGGGITFGLKPADINRRQAPSPYKKGRATVSSALKQDVRTLRENAKEVFKTSRQLTEEQRVLAELLDNKVISFVSPENPAGTLSLAGALRFSIFPPPLDWNMDDDIIYGLAANIITLDATTLAWKEKRRVDAIRPTGQTMEWLFGDRKFKVWGGPGNGNVEIKAGEWRPYLRSMPHSEFPSASACLCQALVDHAFIYTNNNNSFPSRQTIPKGSSRFYPGKIPKEDFVVEVKTLTDWNRICGKSRVWAGVHFGPAVKAGRKLCKGIAGKGQGVVDRLVSGIPDMTWLSWLPADTKRFWEEP